MIPKILAFCGSIRAESFNRQVMMVAIDGAKKAGADVTIVDFRDLQLPLFDEDTESRIGLHPSALHLKDLMKQHHAFLIASPEYNGSITALLKNALDWASRPAHGEKPYECFLNKPVALVSASQGMLGGLRGLVHTRAILSNLQTLVLPQQMAVGKMPDGLNEKTKQGLEDIGTTLVSATRKWMI